MLFFYLSIIDNDEDRAKFERLYKKYAAPMKCYAAKIVNDEYIAEDIVHEAFIRIARHIDGIDESDSHKTNSFIVIIVRRLCIDNAKLKRRQNEIPFDEEFDRNFDLGSSDVSNFDEVEFSALVDIIKGLPDMYRDVLMLKFYHGYSNKEMADMLKISEPAIRKRIERARDLLAYHLKDWRK